MAFAFGRSSVTSRTAPRRSSLTGSAMGHSTTPDKGIAGDGSAAFRQDEKRIDVELDQLVGVALREIRDRQDGLDGRPDVAARLAPEAFEEARHAKAEQLVADLLGR